MYSDGDNCLRSLRMAKGICIHDMAAALNKSDTEYWILEGGSINNVTIGDLKLMIKNFKINPLELIALFIDPRSDPP